MFFLPKEDNNIIKLVNLDNFDFISVVKGSAPEKNDKDIIYIHAVKIEAGNTVLKILSVDTKKYKNITEKAIGDFIRKKFLDHADHFTEDEILNLNDPKPDEKKIIDYTFRCPSCNGTAFSCDVAGKMICLNCGAMLNEDGNEIVGQTEIEDAIGGELGNNNGK